MPLERFAATYRDAARSTLSASPRPAGRAGATARSSCRSAAHARLRARSAGTVSLPVVELEDGAGRLGAVPRPPRPAAGREADAAARDAAARGDPGARRHAAGRGRGAHVELGALASEIAGRVGRRRPSARGAGAPRRPRRRAGRPDRAGARVRQRAGRHGRAASCAPATACWRRSSPKRGRPCARRSTRRSSGRRRGARGPLRRDRGHPPARRRGARARRHRLLGAAAARLGVQDRHARRRARGRGGQAGEPATPSRPRPCSRASAGERQRRVVRRHAAQRVRALLQLRSSRRWAPSWAPSAGRRGGALRLQRRPGARRRDALDDPGRRRDRRRPRGRLDRDRPGPGARHAAAVRGDRRRDRSRTARCSAADAAQGGPDAARASASPGVADAIGRYMRAVVTYGTGTARRSPASRSRARPAPRSCATPPRGSRPDRPGAPSAGRRPDRHERVVRGLRARARRGSPSRSCSSARAPAARRPRRWRRSCSRPGAGTAAPRAPRRRCR